MKRRHILYLGLFLAALLAGLNLLALKFYLYWPKNGLFGFDSFMHFLGGLTLGVLAIWFLRIEKRSLGSFVLVFIVVMILGGIWEAFEHLYGLAGVAPERYWNDTNHDLVMDGLGAIVAYFSIVRSHGALTSQQQQLS